MRLDTHVHSVFSGYSTIRPLRKVMRESYNSVDGVYRRAKARGMDLVAITDHDTIDGALTIADRPDVIIGCEVTGVFPRDGVRVHLGVIGISEAQHREIQRLRHDVAQLHEVERDRRIRNGRRTAERHGWPQVADELFRVYDSAREAMVRADRIATEARV